MSANKIRINVKDDGSIEFPSLNDLALYVESAMKLAAGPKIDLESAFETHFNSIRRRSAPGK